MEKDRHYRAYEGMKAANNGNTSSLKRNIDPSNSQSREVRCLCFGGVPDKASRHSFVKGFFINLGLCALLVAYTLLGSFIFLAIEGGTDVELQQRTLATTIASGNQPLRKNTAAWLKKMNRARNETVENMWKITYDLNVLYQDNWTRLADQEIARFQDEMVKLITGDMTTNQHTGTHAANDDRPTERKVVPETEWNFAKAFFYSLSVLTTIGHGGIAPRSSWGKLATMGYATFGIPLTLVYLSSAGGLLSRCARGVFTRAVCCCLCSNCGYCCYDERRMQEKERRMRKKRQQEEMNQQQQQQPQMALQEPFYVRANASTYLSSVEIKASPRDEVSSLGSGDRPNVTIFAPISICVGAMLCYIAGGAFTLYELEGWNFVDASYFCFMSLSTIGFGDIVPGSYPNESSLIDTKDGTIWFCSCYIMSGLALTAMCFNILQDEILHHLSHQSEKSESIKPSCSIDELTNDPFSMTT